MIQDIAPDTLDLTFRRQPPVDDDIVVAVKGNKVLLPGDSENARLPRYREFLQACPDAAGELVYLFSVSGTGFHYFDAAAHELAGYGANDMMFFYTYQPGWEAFGGITACHLGRWYAANRFCGGCATQMEHKEDERAMRCPGCGSVVYPRISPVVIVGVVDGDRILLTRDARRPNARLTALVAGFVEIGETLEDTVRREVMEEVGLRVKNIRYRMSQPWPFTESVLMGFYADLDGTAEITLDETELKEARWLTRDELPATENPLSMTATLVEAFRTGNDGSAE